MISLETLTEMKKEFLMAGAAERLEGHKAYLKALEALTNKYNSELKILQEHGLDLTNDISDIMNKLKQG